MKLYAIDTYPVPHGNGTNNGFTIINYMPDFVAFSDDKEYILELNAKQVADCLPHHCHNTVPLRRVGKTSCIMAIFRSDHPSVIKNCQIGYRGYQPFPNMVTDLTHGQFFGRLYAIMDGYLPCSASKGN